MMLDMLKGDLAEARRLVDLADLAVGVGMRDEAVQLTNRAIGALVAVHTLMTADPLPEPDDGDVIAA